MRQTSVIWIKNLNVFVYIFGDLEDDARDKVQVLNREIAEQVVMPRIDVIQNKFSMVEGLEDYLKQYADDIIQNVEFVLEQRRR